MSIVERERVETEVAPVTTKEVLHRAADILEEWNWCQYSNARLANGGETNAQDYEAVSFCLYGAAHRAGLDLGLISGDDPGRFGRFNDEVFNPAFGADADGLLVNWNNVPGRTKAEVVTRLRDAANAL